MTPTTPTTSTTSTTPTRLPVTASGARAAASTVAARPARCGITLIEVLATLTLIGIVLPVTMYAINVSLQAAAWSRHQQEAAMLAELKLSEFLIVRDVSLMRGAGDFGEEWPEYRWQSDYALADFGLYEVHVTVAWTRRGEDRSLTLGTLVYPLSEDLEPGEDEEVGE